MKALLNFFMANSRISRVLDVMEVLEPLFPEVQLSRWERFWWAFHYARLLSMLEEALCDLNVGGVRVLEVGVGYGVLATCASEYAKVTAVEHPSREYMRDHRYLDLMKSKDISIVAADLLEGLPFRDGSFNVVFFCDVWEHLYPEFLPQVLQEIKRVLSPGGFLIISTPNLARLENRVKFLLGRSPNPPFPAPMCGKTYGHIREYTLKEVEEFAGRFGFKTVRRKIRALPVFEQRGPTKALVAETVKVLLPFLGDEIYMLCSVKGCR